MKLTSRLVTLLVLTLAALVAIDGYLEYSHERELIRDGMGRDARVLGNAMSGVLGDVWKARGPKRALELIADANEHESEIAIRWVWLDAQADETLAPEVSSNAEVLTSVRMGSLINQTTTDGDRLYAYFSVPTDHDRPGALELSQSTETLSRSAERITRRSIIQLVVLFVIAALTVYVIGMRLIARPLGELMKKIDRVGDGDLSGPLDLPGGSELTLLADSLNTMCERLAQSQARVIEETDAKLEAIEHARHADRLRTVGQLASGVAHELGTPLNVVGGRAALIEEGKLDEAQVTESAEIIIAQAERMTEIVRQLLAFARRGSSAEESVDIEKLARQSLALVRPAAKKKDVTVVVHRRESGDPVAPCSSSAIQQVLTNLILNAIQASMVGTKVQVEVGAELAAPPENPEAEASPCVRVDVRDSGEGISNDDLPRVFEPFFTTRDVGLGTGLGLSIVHGILQDHGGWITVTSRPGAGSCFTFYLPANDT